MYIIIGHCTYTYLSPIPPFFPSSFPHVDTVHQLTHSQTATMRQTLWTMFLAILVWGATPTMEQSVSNDNENTTTLRILLIGPFPSNYVKNVPFDGGHRLIPSALLAIDEINNDSRILANYRLEPVIGNGGCTFTDEAMSRILEDVVHRPSDEYTIGVVGPVCSEATLAVAAQMTNARIRLPLVTIANSPALTNRTLNQFTFGAVSTAAEYGRTAVTVFREMDRIERWNKIAVLYEGDRPYNLELFRAFTDEAVKANISGDRIFASPLLSYYMPLDEIIKMGIRVIFVFSSKGPACRLMCLAYHLGMTDEIYQFILTDRRLDQFHSCVNKDSGKMKFRYNSKEYVCTTNQLERPLQGAVTLYYHLEGLSLENNTTQTVSGYTYTQYRERYEARLQQYAVEINQTLKSSVWAAPFYDAVWAIALAANRTLPNLTLTSQLNVWEEDQLMDRFTSLDFQGVSTRIRFSNETGFANSVIDISQIINNSYSSLVGYYNAGKILDDTDRSSNSGVFNLFIPSSFGIRAERISVWLSVPGYLFTVLAFAATVVYHALHIAYRNRPALKASSPKLNHFIFLSCYMLLFSVFLSTTSVAVSPPSDWYRGLCYTVACLQSLGITIVFSTLFVKYYRLYLVFLKTYDHRSNLSNAKLSIMVAVLVAIDVVILVVWISIKPLEIHSSVKLDNSEKTPINRMKRICRTTDIGVWVSGVIYGYLALLILAVVTLSILNRRIKQRDFNTTATTNILVYLYALMLGILLPSTYIESSYSNIELKYGITNALYLMFTVLCLIFLFTPPLLLRNRRARKYSLSQSLHKMSNILFVMSKMDSGDKSMNGSAL